MAIIRPALPADYPAITRIYEHAVLHGAATFELEPPAVEEMARRIEGLLQGGFPYLVTEAEGTVVGYAYASTYRARAGYRFSVEDSIYLAPEWQRRGLGAPLLGALLEESERRGFRQMIAVIGDSANAGSIALHARLGFQHVGTFRTLGFKFGRWFDSVLMQRQLATEIAAHRGDLRVGGWLLGWSLPTTVRGPSGLRALLLRRVAVDDLGKRVRPRPC